MMSSSLRAPGLATLLVLVTMHVNLRAGQVPDASDPVRAAEQALRAGRYPWYERDEDRLQALPAEPPPPAAKHRDSRWEKKPPRPQRAKPSRSGGGASSGQPTRFFDYVAWSVLGLLLFGIAAALVWAYRRSEPSRRTSTPPTVADTTEVSAAFENLPFVLEAAPTDLLAEARRSSAAGDFRRAIVLLFSYELLLLDQRRRIALARGKTNRQYLRELRDQPPLQRALEQTMLHFEDVYFGKQPATAAEMALVWQHLESFHRELEPVSV